MINTRNQKIRLNESCRHKFTLARNGKKTQYKMKLQVQKCFKVEIPSQDSSKATTVFLLSRK